MLPDLRRPRRRFPSAQGSQPGSGALRPACIIPLLFSPRRAAHGAGRRAGRGGPETVGDPPRWRGVSVNRSDRSGRFLARPFQFVFSISFHCQRSDSLEDDVLSILSNWGAGWASRRFRRRSEGPGALSLAGLGHAPPRVGLARADGGGIPLPSHHSLKIRPRRRARPGAERKESSWPRFKSFSNHSVVSWRCRFDVVLSFARILLLPKRALLDRF